MRVESCAECGSSNLSLDEAETEGSQIVCRDCWHEVGTFGHVKELLLAELKSLQVGRAATVLSGREKRKAP